MANVYVEPRPKGRSDGAAIDHYVLEHAGGTSVDGIRHGTQEAAIKAAKALGHSPLVGRVRDTSKGNPDHWRSA